MTVSTENKFAVVGLGGIFPDATDVEQYWRNILDKKVSIGPLPQDCIERDVFFRPEVHRRTNKGDRSYTDLLATVSDLDFDAGRFHIPPTVATRMDDNQKAGLLAVDAALAFEGLKSVSKDRVAVFMGNSMAGQLHHDYLERFSCDKYEYYLRQQPAFMERLSPQEQEQLLAGVRDKIVGKTPSVTEDTAPGILPNIIAARINSVFDLHGHAYVVDAACASALAATICGIQQLRLHEVDAVICGAADIQNAEVGRIYFSAIGALSPDGSFPFDERANGFVPGDGAGVIVIKRLYDAIVARDRIFGVISGYGQASDGKGKAIAAPNELWQAQTIRRAWEMAGVSADSIELIEAHGTSTQVGDLSEVNALKRAFQGLGANRRGYCGIGSVKSNIGHLKSAAGIAGLLKALMAVDKKVLPPTAGFATLNPKLELSESPFYVLSDAQDWQSSVTPRRAGVSAFGFGGADYHIALEEYREGDYSGLARKHSASAAAKQPVALDPVADVESPAVLFFSAKQTIGLLPQVEAFAARAAREPGNWSELIIAQNLAASALANARLAFPLSSVDDLRAKIELIRQWQDKPEAKAALLTKGIALESTPALDRRAVAVLFPGQGSQYPDMLKTLRNRYAAAHQVFLRADAVWRAFANTSVSELIDSSLRGLEKTDRLLRETQNTHPALFVSCLASYRVLEEMGFVPGVIVGHSVGEFTALAASGRLAFRDALTLLHARANAFTAVQAGQTGGMLALPCGDETAIAHLNASGVKLAIANVNSPDQTVVSGTVGEVQRFMEYCERQQIKCVRLNVSHAFHSPLMVPAEARFRQTLDETAFRPGSTAVIANGSNEYYQGQSSSVQTELRCQMTGSVRFAQSIERLYADGVRLFVEVGPGSVLSQLVRDTLRGRDVTVLSSDNKRGDSLEALRRMVCGLFVAGVEIDPTAAALRQVESRPPTAAVPDKSPVTVGRSSAIVNEGETLTLLPPVDVFSKAIVYSGASVGLPGSYKASFRDDNFEQLFEGRNFIERLTDEERRRLVELRISTVVKSEQGASFTTLSALNEVIQLAGRLGQLDLDRDYSISEKDIANMSHAIAHAIAAGYEALKDAQIPLIHEYARTAAGSMLPERWALPREMQRHTGVIFANGFPMIDPIIQEVSRHLSYRLGRRAREELFEFYDSLIAKVTDRESRKLLSDWFALNYQRLAAVPSQSDVYNFNHHLMTQIAMQANNRLAQFINARGPNFQINAACSSTATAVTLAEELIRGGRAKRIIVIGADDPSSEHALPYLGAGFLSTGACTNASDLYDAALPFDKRRNGMIMGAGAVGIVVEAESECKRRGVIPLCELMGSHCFNTAGHNSQLDVPRYAEELDMFMTRMESLHGAKRKGMARKLVYVSHETYTPARGGCSEAEVIALRHVFGEDYREIEISNTKGMTGHLMGASIEDAVAAKALQFGKAPPVVNHRQVDPALEGLKLGTGVPGDFEYALRMAAGFGSQGNYILLKRRARGQERIEDPATYASWLNEISGLEGAALGYMGRVLIVKEQKPGSIVVERPQIDSSRPSGTTSVRIPPNLVPNLPEVERNCEPVTAPSGVVTGSAWFDVKDLVFGVVAEITGYETAILDLDMELEADLGIDTVKQATVLATLAERLKLTELSGLRLSEYPTLRRITELCTEQLGRVEAAVVQPTAKLTPVNAIMEAAELASDNPLKRNCRDRRVVASQVLEVIASVTGYSLEILGEDMELEADLGIDTVKQATVLSLLGERFELELDTGMKLSELSTIRQMVDYFSMVSAVECAPTRAPMNADPPPQERNAVATVTAQLYAIIGRVTPYPSEMLEPELTVQSDLELSAEVQCELRAALVKTFDLPRDWCIPYNASLGRIVELLKVSAKIPERCDALSVASQPREQALGRQVLVLRPAPVSTTQVYGFTQKRIWVLGDDACCVARVRQRFAALGCEVRGLVFPESSTPVELYPVLEELLSFGAPEVLIDLTASPVVGSIREEEPTVVLRGIERAANCRFAMCKWLAERKAVPERILAVTALDGRFALQRDFEAPQASAIYGLHIGFYKAVRKEWANCFVSILDLAPKDWDNDGAVAVKLIEHEIAVAGKGVEICYLEGERHRLVTEDSSWSPEAVANEFTKDDVVVVTGGGSGVTAQIALTLGQTYSVKFALIGRTALERSAKGLEFTDEASKSACKVAIQKRLTSLGERVTPALIERTFARLERSAEIYKTLETLEQYGCEARYYEADVCDLRALRTVVASIRTDLGPITTLVHGAGIEISHRIEQKSLEEFCRVYTVKAVGAYQLDWLCRSEPLRRIVAVSSIAGRYGNWGQTDYSAGNSFLDVLMRSERRSSVRGLSLIWSGWGELGMAWRNSFVREHAENQGLNFIEPASGAKAAVAELSANGGPSEVVIHRGLGDVIDAHMADDDLRTAPLIDWVEKQRGVVTSVHRRLSPRRDAFLNQHRFAGIPYMPGVGFMEIMAETAALFGGPLDGVYVFRDLAFLDGLKLYRDEPRDIRLDISRSTTPGPREMIVRALFKPKFGGARELRDYARAWVEVKRSSDEPIKCPSWSLELTEETTYAELFENAKNLRQNVHLGPLFNDAHRAKEAGAESRVLWSPQGIETFVPFPRAQLDNPGYPLEKFRINPAFLDALHQAGAVLAIQLTEQVYLPVGAEEFVVYEAPRHDETYRVLAKLTKLDDVQATYDMVMTRADGTCCARLSNSQFRRINA